MRYMAYDAGLDFVDDIVDFEKDFLGGTWESTKKYIPELAGPFKALPVVQHNGSTINETGACAQYIAEIAGYMPKSPLDRARVIMICDHIYEDILINISYGLWGFREWDRDVIGDLLAQLLDYHSSSSIWRTPLLRAQAVLLLAMK